MRLSSIFEQDPATASGAASVSRALGSGASGVSVARALGKAERGEALNPTLVKALAPYADTLDKILSTPAFRNKFTQLIKQVQMVDKKNQELAAQQGAVTEDQDSVDAVASSITRRIMMQHTDLLSKYGPVKVMAAIDDVAEFAGGDGLDEIGSSDVSIWTKQVIQDLEAGHYDRLESVQEAEGEDVVDTVTMDVPLLLRVMEYAREDAHEDIDLHDLAERMIAMSKDGPLSMDDYDSLVGGVETPAEVDEVSNKTLSSYTDKAAKERDTYHADRNKDAESARKYYNRKAGVRKALSITKEDQLDELSPQTLGSYVSKSVKDEKERRAHGIRVRDELRAATGKNFGTPIDRKLYSPTASRASGQKRAIDKLTGKSKVPAQEGYYTPGPETMPGAVGPQETTNVSFNQTKRMGDATVTVSANARDMEELHRVLKLAGIEVKGEVEAEPSVADAAVALAPHMPAEPAEEPCGCDDAPEAEVKPLDFKYSTDKTALVNVLRDKLKRL